ncbi:hypothetical protein PM082_010392 [Marasmius tenuissimus]|nr:hypothetical protein PM082_010392 [Marasmius tenuissimus]
MDTLSPFRRTSSSVTARPALPDVQNLFRNTVTPSDRPIISQFLLDTETELKECQAEINRLKTSIHLLENKKLNLKDCLEKCRSLLSPIHRLPTETLTHIFAYACEDSTLQPSSLPVTMLLTTICGRWRDVVLSTPRLWSSLKINFVPWKKKADHLVRLTTSFIEHSKTSPLDIAVTFPIDSNGSDEWISSVVEVLSRGCARWRSLSLSLPNNITLPNDLFQNVRGQALPLLQYLQINNRNTSGVASNLDVLAGVFDVCTSLRTLDIERKTAFVSVIGLPCHQITRLNLYRAWSSDCLAFARLFQRLQELHFQFVVAKAETNTESLVSNTIQTLSLSSRCQKDHDALLKHMTLLELESLTFSSWSVSHKDPCTSWSDWNAAATTEFLSRSRCSLTSLHLQSLPITDQQTIDLLQTMPQLTSLKIEEFQSPGVVTTDLFLNKNRIVTDEFLHYLVVNQERYRIGQPGTSFLPLLTDLTVKLHAQTLPEQSLFAAVSSRWIPDPMRAREIGVECLKSVDIIVVGGEDSESTLESLRCFRDAGLRLNIDYIEALL